MEKKLIIRAPAKVNLTLRVVGRRLDGYHLLNTLVVPISIYDTVEIAVKSASAWPPRRQSHVTVLCDHPAVPNGKNNLAYQAAVLFLQEKGIGARVTIHIHKDIPPGSGLGGGSSDAAAVLKGLVRLLGGGLPRARLMKLAERIGADVPFFIPCRPAWVEGVGETVTPLERFSSVWLVMVVPPFPLATTAVYAGFRRFTKKIFPATMATLDRMHPLREMMQNDLEKVVQSMYPGLAKLKAEILRGGAEGAVMTGSGPAVCGLFATVAEAQRASSALAKEGRKIFVVRTLAGPPRPRRVG